MILKEQGWIFDIDLTDTMLRSNAEAEEHCTCAYCRNYYETIDGTYPDLRPFLARFGIDIEGPDELMPLFPPTECIVSYSLTGSIIQQGSSSIRVAGLMVAPEIRDGQLILTVSGIRLPWTQSEPLEDVESPANQPYFMEKIWRRIYGSSPSEDAPS